MSGHYLPQKSGRVAGWKFGVIFVDKWQLLPHGWAQSGKSEVYLTASLLRWFKLSQHNRNLKNQIGRLLRKLIETLKAEWSTVSMNLIERYRIEEGTGFNGFRKLSLGTIWKISSSEYQNFYFHLYLKRPWFSPKISLAKGVFRSIFTKSILFSKLSQNCSFQQKEDYEKLW